MESMLDKVKKAKDASYVLATSSDAERKRMLLAFASELEKQKEFLFCENEKDLKIARDNDIKQSLLYRLSLTKEKLDSCIEGLMQLVKLPDPVGKVKEKRLLDEDMVLEKVTFPIGMIGMIFEARPDAMIQIIGLAIRTGNGLILKGGKEANLSNTAILKILSDALSGAPFILLLSTHSDVDLVLKLDKYVDLLIPRGSNEFVSHVMANTKIPVIGHADGICAVYVDDEADFEKALRVVYDSKTQYPSACNAVETVLVHEKIAKDFLPLLKEMLDKGSVEIRGDERTRAIIECKKSNEADYHTEFLDLILAVKIVSGIDDAILHIKEHSSHHTDAIVTESEEKKDKFFISVDSADVFCNASTRFADGFRFGLGAEVGISTGKIHARGPVGLDGLTTTKWLISGNGNIVADYSKAGGKKYLHKDILNA